MNKRLYLLFTLLVFISLSCEKESRLEISPCTISVPGMICKEYRYTPDEFLGTIEYFYNNQHQLVRQDIFSSAHSSKHIYYDFFSNGNMISRRVFDENSNLKEFNEYYYNEFDSICTSSEKIDGVMCSISTYTYDQDKNRILKKTEKSDGSSQYIEYQYDNNKLFKEIHKNSFHQLVSYILYDYFSNGVTRFRHYDANQNLVKIVVNIMDKQRRLTERRTFTSVSQLHLRETWTYEHDLLVRYGKNNGDNSPLEYIIYQY